MILSIMTILKWVMKGEIAGLRYFSSTRPLRKLVKDILTSVLSGIYYESKIFV